MTENETKTLERFEKFVYSNGCSPNFLVKLIKLCQQYGNIKTIPQYAKDKNKTIF